MRDDGAYEQCTLLNYAFLDNTYLVIMIQLIKIDTVGFNDYSA